ncbi:MAG: ABC transporter permease [Actinobacteria bacterium]|nr:ABC transporter permease [Actinomycetota bacterium]
MLLLTLRDLQHRLVRVVLVIVGTSLVFVLLLLMSGLTEQFSREGRVTVAAIGADAWLLRNGATGAFTSAATLEPEVAHEVREAEAADPLITARHSLRTEAGPLDIVVLGHVPGGLGSPHLIAGDQASAGGDVVIDESSGLRVGDTAQIGALSFHVTGLTEDTTLFAGMPLVFMDLEDAQRLVYRGRPSATAVVIRGELESVPDGYVLLSNDEVADDAKRPLKHAISSVNLIRSLLWVVSGMIIGGVVYLSALERRRDFAVMKAVGTSTASLLVGLALQGVLIALGASLLATGIQALLVPVFPLRVTVTSAVLLQLPVIAALVAILASLGGMRQVAKTDPASAFAGQGG